MKLRPHHLLCTQTFAGMGYNDDFTTNMTGITDQLRNGGDIAIELVFSTDDICAECPNMIGEGLCANDEKVCLADKKTTGYLHLEEKSYIYGDIVREINSGLSETAIDDICSGCVWYSVGECKKRLLENRQAKPT